MTPGQIVIVDWRDALAGSGEPNNQRPAIVIGSPSFFQSALPFEIVVPLTGEGALAITGASLAIEPSSENGCKKRSYALAWCVQAVSHSRVQLTGSRVTLDQVRTIRKQVAGCIDAV